MATTHSMGTTLKFTPSGGTQVTVGKLSSIGEISPEAEDLDVTTLDSEGGYREYIQGYRDAGELEVTGFHDSDDEGQLAIRDAFDDGTTGQAVISFPDGSTATFSAFVKSYTVGSAEVDGAIGFGAVFRISGAVVVT